MNPRRLSLRGPKPTRPSGPSRGGDADLDTARGGPSISASSAPAGLPASSSVDSAQGRGESPPALAGLGLGPGRTSPRTTQPLWRPEPPKSGARGRSAAGGTTPAGAQAVSVGASLGTAALGAAWERDRARLKELFVELAYERRPVTLSSGAKSDFYIDSKQAVLTAEGHYLVGRLFHSWIEALAPHAQAVGGMTLGADPLASATALQSWMAGRPRNAFYVRKEPKSHGTQHWLEGQASLRPGMSVVVLEDVVTTGASTLRAIERIRAQGLSPVLVIALVDRQEENGRANVERECPLVSLFRKEDFQND